MGYMLIAAAKDENGKYVGGKTGDQTGKEVYEYVFKDSRAYYYWAPITQKTANAVYKQAKLLADNDNIGYDQGSRLTAWEAYRKYGSIKKIKEPCECDCSSALRLVIYAALKVDIGNRTTDDLPEALDRLDRYFGKRQDYKASKKIPTGAPVCTKTKGHAGVITGGYQVAECAVQPEEKPKTAYYPKYTGDGVSIVDALKAVGETDAGFAKRKKIAKANGIAGYKGTEEQNLKLLFMLKKGKLKKV